MSAAAILRDLFGAGTWGTGGNLVASAILTVPAVIIAHVRQYRQRERHHAEQQAANERTARIAADLHEKLTGEAHPCAPAGETESEAK